MLARLLLLSLMTLLSMLVGPARAADDLPELLYVARTGLTTTWFVPVGRKVGAPIRISPSRLSTLGAGPGVISFSGVSPQGDQIALVFYSPEGEQRLYTASTGGKDADAPSLRYQTSGALRGELAFDEDGSVLAFVEGARLMVVNTTGPASALAVDEVGPDERITNLRWSGDRILYNVDRRDPDGRTSAVLRSAGASGQDSRALTQGAPGQQHRVQAVLPGGDLIVMISGVLVRMNPRTGQTIRLTPAELYASPVGLVGDALFVITAPAVNVYTRRLARVALDGHDPDHPTFITEPVEHLAALATPRLVAWSQRTGDASWAVFVSDHDAAAARQITPDLDGRPALVAVTEAGDAVLGCDGQGAITRFEVGRRATPPVRLGPAPPGRVCAMRGLVGSDHIVGVQVPAASPNSFSAVILASDGGALADLGHVAPQIVAGGVIFTRNDVGASIWRSGVGRLSEEHSSDIRETHLAMGGRALIYRAETWNILDLATGAGTRALELGDEATFEGAGADYAVFGPKLRWFALKSTESGKITCEPQLVAADLGACFPYNIETGELRFQRFGESSSAPVMKLPPGLPVEVRYEAGGPLVAMTYAGGWAVSRWPDAPETRTSLDMLPSSIFDATLLPGGAGLFITLATLDTDVPRPDGSVLVPLDGSPLRWNPKGQARGPAAGEPRPTTSARYALPRDLPDDAKLVATTRSYAVVSAGGALYAAPLAGGPSRLLTPEEAGAVSFVALLPD